MSKVLKRYGTITELDGFYRARIGNKKRKFAFISNASFEDKNAAKEKAEAFLIETSIREKRTNVYSFSEDHSICLIQIVDQTGLHDSLTLSIDAEDLHKFIDKVWYCRFGKAEISCPYTSLSNGSRLHATEVVFGTKDVVHRNGNKLDCRKINLTGKILDKLPTENRVVTLQQTDADLPRLERFCFTTGPYIPKEWWSCVLKIAASSMDANITVATKLAVLLKAKYATFPLYCAGDLELFEDISRLERYEFQSNDLSLSKHGILFCRHFFGADMLKCELKKSGGKKHSPTTVWDSKRDRILLIQNCLDSVRSVFDAKQLWRSMSFRFGVATNFSPIIAKQLYEKYAQSVNDCPVRVLDMCAGWGGRFLGFWTSKNVQHYTGIDPNANVIASCTRMAQWLTAHAQDNTKTFKLYNDCAENVEWCAADEFFGRYDVMLTSPPYFDLENYDPSSAMQSCNKFSTYEIWLEKFLHKMLDNAASALRSGGVLLLNIANTSCCPSLYLDATNYLLQSEILQLTKVLEMPITQRGGNARKDPIIMCTKK